MGDIQALMLSRPTRQRPWKRSAPALPPTIMRLTKAARTPPLRTTTYRLEPEQLARILEEAPPSAYRALTERDLVILREYKREIRACDERACLCGCHCHAGPTATCYREELEDDTPSRFHYRTPNPTHKRAHRECPKGDHHK